jgi:hypothetical protein
VPLILFGIATVVHTWPLATDPAGLFYENADVELNAWIVCWVAHQLPRDPSRLFDANTFYPDRDVLAFSEPLIVPRIVAIVPQFLGASAILTHNVLMLGGFFLTALAGFWVGERLSGDRVGGLVAGSIIAFGPHTLGRLAHLQAHWVFALPLSLLALDALVRGRSWRAAMGLGACVAALAVTSGYGLTIGVVALAAALMARAGEWWRDWRGVALRLLAAGFVCVLLAFPVARTYSRVIEHHGLKRDANVVSMGAARPTSFLSTWSKLHYDLWSHRFVGVGGTYFPGLLALVLAGVALTSRRRFTDGRLLMLAAIAAVGAVVAVAPTLPIPLYELLRCAFPPLQSMREPNRFGLLVFVGVGLLAATGVAVLRRRLEGRRRILVPVLLILVAHAEVFSAPFDFKAFEGFSPVYARLARERDRIAVAEFPFYSRDADYMNASYVLASTVHWAPLVNGYSGFATREYAERAQALKLFPESEALEMLRRLGVSHVVVHPARFAPRPGHHRRVLDLLERWERENVERLSVGPSGEALYHLTPRQQP